MECHEVADVGDNLVDVDVHVVGVGVLSDLVIDRQSHREVVWVVDLVGGDEPRPDRGEGVVRLALVPGAAPVELPGPLRDVVYDAVAGDVVSRCAPVEARSGAADDDAELNLVVAGLVRQRRDRGDVGDP